MEYANGDQYVGIWSQGRPAGRGVLVLAHGDRFEGEMLAGQFHGKGKYSFSDGGYYEGEYASQQGGYEHGVLFPNPDGQRVGHGTRSWVSGHKYVGAWRETVGARTSPNRDALGSGIPSMSSVLRGASEPGSVRNAQ